MKKIISLVLAVLMFVTVVPLGVSAVEQWWMPLTSYVSIGDPFGCTCDIHRGNHKGQDFPAYGGTTVRSSKSGTVVAVVTYCKGSHYNGSCSCGSSWGNYVKIKHDDGFYSLYAHLSSVSVSNGQRVSQGQKVGGVGTTGDSTGNHLHFEVYNTSNTRVNPMNYINPNNPSPNGQSPIITDKPKLSSNKTAYAVGEKVVLTRNNVNNTNFYWIVVWYNNKQILSTAMPDSSYILTNLEAGTYEAYLQVGNSNGTISSEKYVFHVQNTISDKGIITSDKKTYIVGEAVTLKRNNVNNTNYYWIVLWYKGKQILSTSMPETTYKLSDLAEGTYEIYLQFGNAVTGTLSSEKYVFYVEKPHTHSYAESVKEATCTSTGLKTYMCSCGASYTETIAKTAHNSNTKIPAVAATCTKTGLTEGKKCSVCGTVTVTQQTVAKKAHAEVTDNAVAATCTATGLTQGKHCSTCNTIIVAQQTVAALGHADNNFDGKCDRCGVSSSTPDEPDAPTDDCSCNCHKGGIVGFFFKIINFFQKLFGKNKVCVCGVAH